MAKWIYVQIQFVTLHEKIPTDYGAKLSIDGVEIDRNKYSIEFGFVPEHDFHDFPEFTVVGATYEKPSDFGANSYYKDDTGGDKSYSKWALVSVPDDFAIPAELLTTGGSDPVDPITGMFDLSSDGRSMLESITFQAIGGTGVGDYLSDLQGEATGALWELAEHVGDRFGVGSVVSSLQDVLTVKDAVTGLWENAFAVLKSGLSNLSNPNFDPRLYDQQVDSLLRQSAADLADAFGSATGLGNSARLALSGFQLSMTIPQQDGVAGGLITKLAFDSFGHLGAYAPEIVVSGSQGNFIDGHGGNDILYGGSGSDTLIDGAGNDYLSGGGGDDLLYIGTGLEPDSATPLGTATTSTIDYANGGDGWDVLFVGTYPSLGGYVGLSGDLKVHLGLGTVEAYVAGISTYSATIEGVEMVVTGSGNDQLIGDWQGNWLVGGAGNNYLKGNAGDDTLVSGRNPHAFASSSSDFSPIDSSDTVRGGGGFDTLIFNREMHTLFYDIDIRKLSDVEGGTLFIIDGSSFAGIEALEFYGGENNDTVHGAHFKDILVGRGGADILSGWGGDDLIEGGDGNDLLYGGAGADEMWGGTGSDTYFVDNVKDVVIDTYWWQGIDVLGLDTVKSTVTFTLPDQIEALVLKGSGNINAFGNAGTNWLYGNSGHNVLNGAGGADVMRGGSGDDRYFVNDDKDRVIEDSATGGIDTVKSSVSFGLKDNVEVLALTGSNNIGGYGNDQANFIYGNTGANVIKGGRGDDKLFGNDGADRLYGGSGADELTGGVGADRFYFDTPIGGGNVDQIRDYNPADDLIMLDNSVFAGLPLGALASGAFNTGAGATEADDRIIYDPNTGALLFDADGNGAGAAVQFATLNPGLALTAAEFFVF